MITPLGIVLVIFGIMVCFAGYSIFQSMLPLWGFVLGGFIAIIIVPMLFPFPKAQETIYQVAAFGVGGLIGALLARPLYYATVFLSGAAAGALIGMVIGSYLTVSGGQVSVQALTELAAMSFPPRIENSLQVVLMIAFGLIVGGFSISFQKFMISASTALLGAAAVVSGLTGAILDVFRSSPTRGFTYFVVWLALGMIGLFIQFRMRDET
ncbi:MAG TPA: DUF4203 domain-containing protein [Anaerolinea sp.]|nr:DUF4203 domain-containing protein [Anaerolinea sp.]